MLIPMMRRVPLLKRSDGLAKRAARLIMFPERLANEAYVWFLDRQLARRRSEPGPPPASSVSRQGEAELVP
jgi:hypothetical protein